MTNNSTHTLLFNADRLLAIHAVHVKPPARIPLGHDAKSMAALSASIRAICVLRH